MSNKTTQEREQEPTGTDEVQDLTVANVDQGKGGDVMGGISITKTIDKASPKLML